MIFIILAPPTAHYQPVTTVESESLHSFMSQTDSASPINTIIIKNHFAHLLKRKIHT